MKVFASFPLTETSKDIIDHFYHYLSCEMDSDAIVQEMSTQQLFSDNDLLTISTAINKYHKNCLVLDRVRLMNVTTLMTFCNLVQRIDHQKHIGIALLNGTAVC